MYARITEAAVLRACLPRTTHTTHHAHHAPRAAQVHRVYADRLVNETDAARFHDIVVRASKNFFEDLDQVLIPLPS